MEEGEAAGLRQVQVLEVQEVSLQDLKLVTMSCHLQCDLKCDCKY